MALSRSYNPIWYFRDLIGQPLDDSYYAFFLTNTIPYIPQTVYQDISGNIAWSNPIEFLADGALPENIYFPEDTIYRIEIRAGNSQSDALIKLIPNYVPLKIEGDTPVSTTITADNQITTPQFADINFTIPLLLTSVTDITVQVAPGWDLVGEGTGNFEIERINFQGSDNIETNPSYALTVESSGSWNAVYLRQRFSRNGALWSRSAVSAAFTTAILNPGSGLISAKLVDSNNTTTPIIASTLLTNSYQEIKNAVPVPDSTNPDLPNVAYVDFIIEIPTNNKVGITSIQLTQQDSQVALPYSQQTIERQQDHTFHYYKNSMLMMPKKSILTGWNFGLNPWQFSSTGANTFATNSAAYIIDQTILYPKSGANNLEWSRLSSAINDGLAIECLTGNNQHALIQYIAPGTIMPFWENKVSSLVRAVLISPASAQVRYKMRLIYRNSLPPTLSASEPIASWAGVDPVFQAGWTAIAPKNDPIYTFTTGFLIVPGDAFDDFQLPQAASQNSTLGIVLYTIDNANINDIFAYDKITLVPNEFACDEQPQTFDQVLRECEFYFETSYNEGFLPGSSGSGGFLIKQQISRSDLLNVYLEAISFDIPFRTLKRTASSIVTLYPADGGASNTFEAIIREGTPNYILRVNSHISASPNWLQDAIGEKGIALWANVSTALATYTPGGAPSTFHESFIQFHWVADARLGLVP